jgi:hypothetical protein
VTSTLFIVLMILGIFAVDLIRRLVERERVEAPLEGSGQGRRIVN